MKNSKSLSKLVLATAAILILYIAVLHNAHALGAEAAPSPFVPAGDSKQSLNSHLEYLDDASGAYTIEQVTSDAGKLFQVLPAHKPLGYQFEQKAVWLRFSVNLQDYHEPYWFLSFDYQHIAGKFTLYQPTSSGFKESNLDIYAPREGRQFAIPEYFFKLPTLQASSTTYYVKFEPYNHLIRIAFSWSGIKGMVETIHSDVWITGLAFGALCAMWLYNAALYLSLRDRSYLYYVYYLGFFCIAMFYLEGLAPLFIQLTPEIKQFFAASCFFAVHGMILFARQFLSLKTETPKIDKLVLISQWVIFVGGLVACFVPLLQSMKILEVSIIFVLPPIVIAGFLRWWQGYAPAKIYCLGWAIFAGALILSSLQNALQSFGFLRQSFGSDNNNITLIASVWESVMFSLALAYRIKEIQRAKDEAIADQQKKEVELLNQERVLLEQRVTERTHELSLSVRARRLLVATASHELRTPVNTLRLLVDAVEMSATDQTYVIPRVKDIATHMARLVENLLLLDPDVPVSEKQGAVEVFDLGVEILFSTKMVSGAKTRFAANVSLCEGVIVCGDLTALRRIVINLLSNAFKFAENGQVDLIAVAETDEKGKAVCKITVRDNGAGMSPETQQQLFKEFASTGAQAGVSGTGLGLAGASKLAKNLGGSLRLVRSSPGEGAEFECELHFEKSIKEPSMIGAHFGPKNTLDVANTLKVLVAEDDPIAAEALLLILQSLNHNVTHASTAAELTEALCHAGKRFDVALIDNRLPDGKGIDVIKRCRDEGLAAGTMLVLVTGDSAAEILAEASELCDDIIQKPTSGYKIRDVLGQWSLPRQSGKFNFSGGTGADSARSNDIINEFTLAALLESASHDRIELLCGHFYKKFEEALAEIAAFRIQDTDEALDALIHRTESACETVGAVALVIELQEFGRCVDAPAMQRQLFRISETFHATRDALENYLKALRPL